MHPSSSGRIVYHNDSSRYPPGYYEQQYNFDFTNYAGIHRPVLLYTTPISFVDDVSVITIVDEAGTGFVYYKIQMDGPSPDDYSVVVEIYDADVKIVSQSKEWKAEIQIAEPHLWWPRGMNRTTAYLYTLKVQLWDKKRNVEVDVYRLPFGIRMVQWNDEGVFVNGEKVYFKGFGRHEDAIVNRHFSETCRPRGDIIRQLITFFLLFVATVARPWAGPGNAYQRLQPDALDRRQLLPHVPLPVFRGVDGPGRPAGIHGHQRSAGRRFRVKHQHTLRFQSQFAEMLPFFVVILVAVSNFDDQLLLAHTQTLKELIARDKNRPSVVMWSVGNEPQSQKPNSAAYFK